MSFSFPVASFCFSVPLASCPSASGTSGRFIHLEQEKTKLRQDVAGWEKINLALGNVFAKTLSVEKFSDKVILKTTNP